MSKLLPAIVAAAAGFGFYATVAHSADPANSPHENYQLMQKRCNRLSETERKECLQDAKAKHEDSTVGCAAMTGSARKKCLTDAEAHQSGDDGGNAAAQPDQYRSTENPPR